MNDADDRPALELADPKELLLGYLDFYRSVVARKLDGLTEPQLRSSRLPSGWAPLELLNHLVHMEARWVRWGFAAEQLPEPWGDEDQSGRWRAGPGCSSPTSIRKPAVFSSSYRSRRARGRNAGDFSTSRASRPGSARTRSGSTVVRAARAA